MSDRCRLNAFAIKRGIGARNPHRLGTIIGLDRDFVTVQWDGLKTRSVYHRGYIEIVRQEPAPADTETRR